MNPPQDKNQSLKKIIMFGAGQDSTGMIIEMINRKMKIDEVIFSDTGTEQPNSSAIAVR